MASTAATKKAGLFQTLDLGLEPFIDHRQLADFGLDLEWRFSSSRSSGWRLLRAARPPRSNV